MPVFTIVALLTISTPTQLHMCKCGTTLLSSGTGCPRPECAVSWAPVNTTPRELSTNVMNNQESYKNTLIVHYMYEY